MSRRGLLMGLTLALACEERVADPRDQWIVIVGTDAPIPQFGDRILVEMLDRDGNLICGACRRELGVTPKIDAPNAPPPTFPMSFGVVPEDIDRVRVRLYRTDRVGADGLPLGDHIDAIARLPERSGVTEVVLPLYMRCFGVAADAHAQTTCDPATGQLGPVPTMALVRDAALPDTGSWEPAAATACIGAVTPEMVCIEGTAFLVGAEDPLGGVGSTTSLPERLLKVAPFAIDRDEVTVGVFRQTGLATGTDPIPRDEQPASPHGLCTYPEDPGDASRDALPVDCVSRTAAAAACAHFGKRLPTEEEWELAAGSRTLEHPFPWGEIDAQACAKAVLSRGRTPVEQVIEDGTLAEEYGCRGELPPGPVAGGSPLDVTAEGVRNMAGNVDEWVADAFAPYTDPCWTIPAGDVRSAPCVASGPVVLAPHAVRGGSYIDVPAAARVTNRKSSEGGRPAPGRGFRCAKSM